MLTPEEQAEFERLWRKATEMPQEQGPWEGVLNTKNCEAVFKSIATGGHPYLEQALRERFKLNDRPCVVRTGKEEAIVVRANWELDVVGFFNMQYVWPTNVKRWFLYRKGVEFAAVQATNPFDAANRLNQEGYKDIWTENITELKDGEVYGYVAPDVEPFRKA